MKCITLLILFALLSPIGFYGSPLEKSEGQKVHIQAEQIAIDKEGIFIYVEREWVSADTIGFDSSGLYAIYKNPDLRTWRCSRCNFLNAYWDDICQGPYGSGKCLAPRPSK